jgi:type IV secretory pathway TraG/TraD family ATPase VirD4
MIDALRQMIGMDARSYMLRVPREEETEGILLLGDPGTGKSQVIQQLLAQIADRNPPEAVVCYDPAGEFITNYFTPGTDIVLNPLDARCPYWSPTLEVDYENTNDGSTDRHLIAESFFPDRDHHATNAQFFIKSARSIFARMLEFKPTAARIVEMLTDEKLIDEIAKGTEHAHLIDKDAKGQRGGVLATLSEIGESLKLLPSLDDCSSKLSLSAWTRRRRGWIFITSTQDTRDALRTLQAAWINILMKRLLAAPPSWAQQRPCWVVVDEVHSLKRLPALAATQVEGRKYGLKLVLGTQNKAQIEEHYGKGAATMLSAPHLKILFRCNEPESARWVSEMIGEEEKERPRIGTTATVQANGRDSINYSTYTERRSVVSKEQIMALRNLHGYWKYSDAVVPFRIQPVERDQVAHAFVRRQVRSVVEQPVDAPAPVEKPPEREIEARSITSQEITAEVKDGLDWTF